MGRHAKTQELMDVIIEIVTEEHPITVRGVCYRLFGRGLIAGMSAAHNKDHEKVGRLLTAARKEELIPWEWISEEGRRFTHYADRSIESFAASAKIRLNPWLQQACQPLLISEKATVAQILAPVMAEYAVPFANYRGFGSTTAIHELAETIDASPNPVVILYIGDWDPAGLMMSEDDLPRRLAEHVTCGDHTIQRVALTEALTREIGEAPAFLPSTKAANQQAKWFRQHYPGSSCWELDALPAPRLREVVEQSIRRLIDWEAWDRVENQNAAANAALDVYLEAWKEMAESIFE